MIIDTLRSKDAEFPNSHPFLMTKYFLPLNTNVDWDHTPEAVLVEYSEEDVNLWLRHARYLQGNDAWCLVLWGGLGEYTFLDEASPGSDEEIVLTVNGKDYIEAELPYQEDGGEVAIYQDEIDLRWKSSYCAQDEVWCELLAIGIGQGNTITRLGTEVQE